MSAITDFLASQQAGFISLHDLLEAMAQHSNGCTLKQAATALSQIVKGGASGVGALRTAKSLGSVIWSSYTPTEGLQRRFIPPLRGNEFEPDALLERVVRTGKFEEDEVLYRTYGFHTQEILLLLEDHGITLDLSSKDRAVVQGNDSPDWKRSLALRRTLNDYEVGCVLSGIDPYDGHKWDESRMMRDVVLEAIENDEIEFEHSGRENGSVILVRSLAAWCDKNGVPWPLPWNFGKAQAVTASERQQQNEDLQRPLVEAQEKIKRLDAEVSALNLKISSDRGHIDKYKAEIFRLESELARAKVGQLTQQPARDGGLKFLHETRLLHLVAATQERYAGENLNIPDRDTWPKKADVIEWLREQEPGLSVKVAEGIDAVAMPFSRGK